ncbi:MAG: formate acetyltransferase, partial [Candidatus Diapherotrites archaeon]|nr:formate acetyltransferase [Candidatus Diapherotrites archaeon]
MGETDFVKNNKYAWREFLDGCWQNKIDVQNFIQTNYTFYSGNESFLEKPTQRTLNLFSKKKELLSEERKRNGVYDIDAKNPSTITSHGPGFVDSELELIVGYQTDKPLKLGIKPKGGIRFTEKACEAYGFKLDEKVKDFYENHSKTHNSGVFSAYSKKIKQLRHTGLITGLPDNYGRGRIIGDYRRVALYGVEKLILEKQKDFDNLSFDDIQLREEVFEQINALEKLVELGKSYGFDLTRPALNAREAIQWTWFAYLAAIKEQDGAAMSFGRVDAFFDIFIERDLNEKTLTESQAQELIDQLILKMRFVRHLRHPDYNVLFGGQPTWITCVIGGVGEKNPLVTKTSFRMIHTLTNLGPAPEPNITVLWNNGVCGSYKKYCCRISIETSSLQYENDDLMNSRFGSDYAISCCVSAMKIGKQMQFFGARCNGPKLLLLALNGGKDEFTGEQIAPLQEIPNSEYLDFDEVWKKYLFYADWLAEQYVAAMNIIHYMHDKYSYENIQMALHETNVKRLMAFGLAGLSVLADSFSAIKYAKIKPIRNENGLVEDFETIGDFPKYGNDDSRVDSLAVDVVESFIACLKKYPTYRNSEHTLSILTITSNVLYGKKTGAT